MIEDFAFVLMYHGETTQLILSVDHLSILYLVHVIERNFRATCGFSIVILTSLLCLYLIGSFLSVLFLYLTWYAISTQVCAYLSPFKDLVNLVKYRGTVRIFNNCKFFNSLQCKKNGWTNISSDVFLYWILLFTLQHCGVTFYLIDCISLFKTWSA